MHVNAKKMAFGGVLLAMTLLCMLLGSILETNTLFLLALASYFVGIVIREFGMGTGGAFYVAGVLLGMFLAPNKFYVCSYAAMALYILVIEFVWLRIGKMKMRNPDRIAKLFWGIKFLAFNVIYLPMILGFGQFLFARKLSGWMLAAVILGGQLGLFLYDRAYEYVQVYLWGRLRKYLK